MAREHLYNLEALHPDRVLHDLEEIRRYLRQRFEMEQLSGVIVLSQSEGIIVGFKDVTDREFWVRGHIPGRPIMPAVVMIEAAAQLCSFYYAKVVRPDGFLGFAGLDGAKFRGTVVPGDRLILIARAADVRVRRCIFDTQGVVGDRIVFEARITGMPL